MSYHLPARAMRAHWTAALLATTAAVVPCVAQAQVQDANEIIVTGRAITATKTDTPLVEIPQSISVVTEEEMRDRTVVDFQDIYRYSAGVQTTGSIDSRGDFILTRGFDAAQYLDGLKRMPDFIYGARLEPFSLERAEVLRGPSSVLYGAGGSGGVLNGASKMAKFDFGGQAGFAVGTDSRLQAQFDVGGPLSDVVAVRMVALWRDGETQWGTPDDRVLLSPSITFRPTQNTELTLLGLYQKDKQGSLGYAPLFKTFLENDPSPDVAFNFYQGEPGFNGMDTEYMSGTILLSHDFSEALTFRSATRWSDMDTDYKEVYSNYTANPWADAAETMLKREFYVNYEKSRVFNTDNNMQFDIATGAISHTFLFGVNYHKFRQQKDEGYSYDNIIFPPGLPFGSPPPINIYDPQYGADFDFGPFVFTNFRSSQLGFYAQDQLKFFDRINVVLGVRRDEAKSYFNGVKQYDEVAWTFRGGVIGEVAAGISPFFNYAESFLPTPGGDFFGNPFAPREGRQYEGGVKWEPMRGALISAAYFDIKESNYVSPDPDNIQNFLQGGEVGSTGFEFEATIRKQDDYELTASYTYIDAKALTNTSTLAEGDRLLGQPKKLASVWASKTFLMEGDWMFRAGGGVRYVGNVKGTGGYIVPSVTLVDAMASVGMGPWLLSVNAANVLDKKYYASCSLLGVEHGLCTAAKDRTLLASISYNF
ncbi:TonB-dependent siderophore receptor [Croceicoccus ponticola]|nr:TonB-dependent siderophore receptor [Croceicoccus ponticola]